MLKMFNYTQHVTKSQIFSDLAKCLEEVKEWTNRNYLSQIDGKTQLLCVSKN